MRQARAEPEEVLDETAGGGHLVQGPPHWSWKARTGDWPPIIHLYK